MKRLEDVKQPRLSLHEQLLLRILNVYGYMNKQTIENILCIGKSKRYVKYRIAVFLKYNIFDKFVIAPTLEMKTNEQNYAVILGKNGIAHVSNEVEKVRDPKEKNGYQANLLHSCILSSSVFEICNTLKLSGFEIDLIYDGSGDITESVFVVPDAIIIFRTDDNRFGAIYVEVERHYVTEKNIDRKLNRYSSSINDSAFAKAVDRKLSSQRVVYVTEGENKCENLIDKIAAIGRKSIDVLVTSYSNLSTNKENTLFVVPINGQKIKLTRKVNYD